MTNRTQLFDNLIRIKLFKKLSFEQRHSMNVIIETYFKEGFTDERCLAYLLGTIYHETAFTMRPIEEYGWWGRWYSKLVNGKRYYGRGFIQLTHYSNYDKMGKRLGVDLARKPELALDTAISARIAVIGCMEGLFTGAGLPRYFTQTKEDWINARRVVNGLDKAIEIAGYGRRFLEAMG